MAQVVSVTGLQWRRHSPLRLILTTRVPHPRPPGRWPLQARSAVPRSCHVARRSLLPRSLRDTSSRLTYLLSAGDLVFQNEPCGGALQMHTRRRKCVGATVGLSLSSAAGSGTRRRDTGVRPQEDAAGGVCVPRVRLTDADKTADGPETRWAAARAPTPPLTDRWTPCDPTA